MSSSLLLSPILEGTPLLNIRAYHPSLQKRAEEAHEHDKEWFAAHPKAKAMRRQPFEAEKLVAATEGAQCRSVEIRRNGGLYAIHIIYLGELYEGEPVELKVGREKPKGFG